MPQGAQDVEFGAMLRQAREQRGVSLRAIADATKIPLPALEALERNDTSRLPGGIFTRAFVRGYAREVGLDPEDMVRRFVAAFPSQDPSGADDQPRASHYRDVRVEQGTGVTRAAGRVLTVVAAIGLIVAYLAWSGRLASWRRGEAIPVPTPPASLTPAPTVEPMDETVVVTPTEQPGALLLTDRAVSSAVAEAPEALAAAAAGAPAPLPEGSLRLSLSAHGRCWVSLRSNGVHSFSGTMESGDQREVDVHGRVSLTVGDAGAFSYSINGIPARALGGAGEVVTVVFTAETYKAYLQQQ